MGALHEGHLSLIRASRRECDRTVVSVFVNPIQFGPGEDFSRYPRPFAADRRAAARAGADCLFAPSAAAMYPGGAATTVEVGPPLTSGLCGAFRPGHFRGVATVVTKLFNVVAPHAAYFGRKDAQQAAVIRRMVRDLNAGILVRVLPTVREKDGLAMSSRNRYLDGPSRRAASSLYRALRAGAAVARRRGATPAAVRARMRKVLAGESRVRVQYLAVVDPDTMADLRRIRGRALLAVAARVGGVRLIDNLPVGAVSRRRSGGR